jgi:hypothetical protein
MQTESENMKAIATLSASRSRDTHHASRESVVIGEEFTRRAGCWVLFAEAIIAHAPGALPPASRLAGARGCATPSPSRSVTSRRSLKQEA